MPNEFLNPEVIAAAIVGVLERESLLPGLVFQMASRDFLGAQGDTVTLRVPARLDARDYVFRNDRSQPIVVDDLQELAVPVALDHHPYSAVSLTDENLSLDIVAFNDQVVGPQVRAITRYCEQVVASAIEDAPHAWSVTGEPDPFLAAAKARHALNAASVPLPGRVLLLGADTELAFLASPLFVRVDTSGGESALRDANIGRVAGFDTYVSQYIQPDLAFAFHESALALANVAPAVPDGVAFGSSQTYNGYATRWIRDYDAMFLRDRSVVSSFLGIASVNDGAQLSEDHEGENVRIVKIEGVQPPENITGT